METVKPLSRSLIPKKAGAFKRLGLEFFTPALGVAATFFAYGTLANSSQLSFWESLFSTQFIYAMPALLILCTELGGASSFVNLFLAIALTNIRLLPMTIAITPQVKSRSLWLDLLTIHFVALTTWLQFFKSKQKRARATHPRLHFKLGLLFWGVAAVSSSLGYTATALLPVSVLMALLYLNPLYFLLLLSEKAKAPLIGPAIFLGGGLMYCFEGLRPASDWSLLLAGLIGGSVAFGMRKK